LGTHSTLSATSRPHSMLPRRVRASSPSPWLK
jgi:hypothetical protein